MTEMRKMLMIFVDESHRYRESTLYEAIVRRLLAHGIAGATATAGIMGFGVHQHLHHKRLLGIADDRPITIVAVDTEAKLRAVLPEISALARQKGLILLLDAEVIV
jgi:PII-like signaling protein